MTGPRFANATIIAAALFFGLLLSYSLATSAPDSYVVPVRIFLAIGVGFLILSLLAPSKYKVNFSLLLVSSGLSLLAVEVFLGFVSGAQVDDPRHAVPKAQIPVDTRSKREVIRDLRDAGVDAYPIILPREAVNGQKFTVGGVVPLGGIANTTTVWCNEVGKWQIYESDEHGFHNPQGIWGEGGRVDVVSIGDSLTHGYCMESEKNATALIRRLHPKTLNLGSGGSGPLIQFAIIKEYLLELKPKAVLWFYFEGNDLSDLTKENWTLHTLRRYFETDYRQGLASKQGTIDKGLRTYANRGLSPPVVEARLEWRDIRGMLTLRNLRQRIWDLFFEKPCNAIPDGTLKLFDRILRNAKDFVSSWEGDLYFIYLPTWTRYGDANSSCSRGITDFTYHDQIVLVAENADLPVIDLTGVFGAHSDPLSLWPNRLPGNLHYTEEGQRLVAEAVLQAIELER